MNTLDYYTRQKEAWDDKEVSDLRDEYDILELSISEIADIHRRTPGSISYKLMSLGIVPASTASRGYLEYKGSALYKEIVEAGNAADAQKKEKKEEKKEAKLKKESHRASSAREIEELKKEVASLRNDVKEILRLMNAVYEFENQ